MGVQQPAPVRGFLMSVGLDPEISVDFQYNPEKLTDKRSVSYATLNAPGMLMPVRHYSNGGDRTISFTVIVDGLFEGPGSIEKDDAGSILPELTKYRAFMYPRTERWKDAITATRGFTELYADSETTFAAPPVCLFGFGERLIDCVVTDVDITEQLFTPDLAPLRAEVKVTCTELTPYNPDPTLGGGF